MIECLKENNIDEETLLKAAEERNTSAILESKCFSYCIMEKTNLLDESKHIKMDEYKERWMMMRPGDMKKIEKIPEMCPEIHEEMDCDKARTVEKCILDI